MKRIGKTVLAVTLLLMAAAAHGEWLIDDFEDGLSPRWEEKEFEGRTDYRVVSGSDGHYLQARSAGSASGLIYEMEYDLEEFPVLSWRWKVDGIIETGDARRKSGDDYAARVYVIFPHWFFPKTRSINYIWANQLPRGEALPNPYTSNAIMVAVESGPEKAGQWVEERRNVREDFRRLFGEDPWTVGAIAVMTDTDQTGETARAGYDDIRLERAGTD